MSVRCRHEFTIAKLEVFHPYKGLSPAISSISSKLPPFLQDTQSSLLLERLPYLLSGLLKRNKDGYLCVS
ncbi:MAG: hypothetical protein K2Y39_22535 [Candidatus Obscuribacterales bacterium]|nr:hypothetical protein [Candidatus Obscuribacterales bacterium]